VVGGRWWVVGRGKRKHGAAYGPSPPLLHQTDLRFRLPGPRLSLRPLEQLIKVKLLCRVRVLTREGLVLLTPLLLLL
jgi:hypothetical protein